MGAWERWWIGGVVVLMGLLYVWTAVAEERTWQMGRQQTDYYNLLIDGFLAGQLHLKTEVSPELAGIANPYDPRNRPPGVALHDATYYKGKYYLYFGVAPVVTLMLPFRVLTGWDLPLPLAVATFAYAGYLLSAALFLSVRRRYFPTTSGVMTLLCVAALGLASMALVVVRRGNIWELPLSSGYCFAMAALLAVHRSLLERRRAPQWFALAGLFLGLAVASRLSYLYATGLMLAPLGWWWWRDRQGKHHGAPRWPRMLVAGVMPLAIIGAGLALYNYLRFDHPLEFGVTYQLSGVNEAETRHFRFSYFPFNVNVYFWRAAEWSRYFPFLHQPETPPLPAGFVGLENLYGVLPGAPILWLALLAPLGLWQRTAAERGSLGALLVALGLLALATTLTLAFFYAAMARYLIDFVPTLLLLACIGVMSVGRWGEARWRLTWPRSLVAALSAGLLAFSSFFGLMFGLELYGNFERLNPRAYPAVAFAFNYPTHLWETLTGSPYGPREYAVQFGPSRTEGREPLVVTGREGRSDEVFVQYESDGSIRIGFAHEGGATVLSRRLPAGSSGPRRLRVEMGSLYPPEAHPFWAGLGREVFLRFARRLRVEVDGEVLLDGYQRFHAASPRLVFAGVSPYRGIEDAHFSGQLREMPRGVGIRSVLSEQINAVAFRVRFAAENDGSEWALFSTGEPPAAASVWSCQATAGFARLRFREAGGVVVESDPFALAPDAAHLFEWVQSAPGDGDEPVAVRVIVKLNGRPIWTLRPAAPLDFSAVQVGGHSAAASADFPRFLGEALIRREPGRDAFGAVEANYTAIRLRVQFPIERPGVREPLIVTGESGAADFIWVEYLNNGDVRFGLDHWGQPPVFSRSFRVDRTAEHWLEISLGSFPGFRWNRAGLQHLTVRLNGATAWETETRLYRFAPEDLFIGHNPVGGTAGAPAFTGSILEVQRVRSDSGADEAPQLK